MSQISKNSKGEYENLKSFPQLNRFIKNSESELNKDATKYKKHKELKNYKKELGGIIDDGEQVFERLKNFVRELKEILE